MSSSKDTVIPTDLGRVRVSIESGLESPGDTISHQDKIEVERFEIGGRVLALPEGLTYDVALTNTGDGILATGIVRGRMVTACDRCLDEASFDVASEVSCYYLREEPDAEEVDDEDDYGLIDAANGCIDLADTILGAVAMDIPFVVLCDDDCLGLCPTCGANLNVAPCGCVSEPDPDFELAKNPFAALANFQFADGTNMADYSFDEECEDAEDEDDLSDEEFEAAWNDLHEDEDDEQA